ncbi:penicillin acylase family protein [Alteromonas sp. 345S023]|uniref:Penicillin acylase family protein n=1 Tax=Alteromonas profundi TaxID=2696062 RepID=A0A7X5RJN2_9ALTE|nr:penicillin acylase family protein [Alteromonas profundi]
MLTWIKWLVLGAVVLVLVSVGAIYATLFMSLPTLDGNDVSQYIDAPSSLERDELGHAIVTTQSKFDAAFVLGFAHAQDRYFQMDLQRRTAAGELAQWVGEPALALDKRHRFHQFSQRAKKVFENLPVEQQEMLVRYAHGVNTALSENSVPPFEYIAAGVTLKPWRPTDSILVAYSMYLDLQGTQIELDLARTALKDNFGEQVYRFITQPSNYQAALDGSEIPLSDADIPTYPHEATIKNTGTNEASSNNISSNNASAGETARNYNAVPPADIGSNNYAVTGELTPTGSGLLANDMHLGLRVPIIWYRTQLNYLDKGENIQVTGVSLPGLPGVIVGTNNHIAWGFTNANLDNVDWIALKDDVVTTQIESTITVGEEAVTYSFEHSDYGPVTTLGEQRYALNWVAHHPFAVNLSVIDLASARTIDDAIRSARRIAMPVQNLVIVDKEGSAAWTPAGAVMARNKATETAITQTALPLQKSRKTSNLPVVKNPDSKRIWTANARVITASDMPRLGDGGYALGARARQIRDRLFEKDTFTEEDFYAIQLDNHAQFLIPWHHLLSGLLTAHDVEFKVDLAYLGQWQECACEDSVGYTLVKHFRRHVIQKLFGRLLHSLDEKGVNSRTLLRGIEPATWELIHTQPNDWLPPNTETFDELLVDAYREAKHELLNRYSPQEADMATLRWGEVNKLTITHPFAAQIPGVGHLLNMDTVEGFGDTFMPSVQAPNFGASQRFFVSPGHLDRAILTLPGGQSGHPLSPFYAKGFNDYASHGATPLLPGQSVHKRQWYKQEE